MRGEPRLHAVEEGRTVYDNIRKSILFILPTNGGEALTTNNRMELMAVIKGLQALKRPCHVDVTTDSQYVKNGITQWIHNWKRNGWRTAARKPVKNDDLWRLLDEVVARHAVSWHWVKGHSGHPENERADALANRGIDEL